MYLGWTKEAKESALSKIKFNRVLRDRGFQMAGGAGNIQLWKGIAPKHQKGALKIVGQ